jgi:hypothetical protein
VCAGGNARAFEFAVNAKSFSSVSETLESMFAVSEVGAQGGDGFFVLVRPAAAPADAASRGTLAVACACARVGSRRWARVCVCVCVCVRARGSSHLRARDAATRCRRAAAARVPISRCACVSGCRACGCGAARACGVRRAVWCAARGLHRRVVLRAASARCGAGCRAEACACVRWRCRTCALLQRSCSRACAPTSSPRSGCAARACVGVCVRVCVRACVCASASACVLSLARAHAPASTSPHRSGAGAAHGERAARGGHGGVVSWPSDGVQSIQQRHTSPSADPQPHCHPRCAAEGGRCRAGC